MEVATLYSRAALGIHAPLVKVEAYLSPGLPGFSIVGLPETAVKESRDRVRSALLTTNFEFPDAKIIVNLAPADIPKLGSRFDLPIALSILAASKQIDIEKLLDFEYIGELGLMGDLRPITGALPVAVAAKNANRNLILPQQNAEEASFIQGLTLLPAQHLLEICAHLNQRKSITPYSNNRANIEPQFTQDMNEVYGQTACKRAMTIAAAGRHNILLFGPPGTGKSMLASRATTLLPLLSEEEAVEVATVHSISHYGFQKQHWRHPPFRAPHHSASSVALVGGSSPPKPGEISLAHRGILFLDELPEFSRSVLEALREPLESGSIHISRAAQQMQYPANFQLIAAMNPCPCGYYGSSQHRCRCTPDQIKRYRNKISGPLLDRIDLQVELPLIKHQELLAQHQLGESSDAIRKRVVKARAKQLGRQNKLNNLLSGKEFEQYCILKDPCKKFLETALEKLNISTRAYHRILRVARSIADLANEDAVDTAHLSEAIYFRQFDRD